MLVLSRRLRQEIVIGDNIVIQVVDIRNGFVKLGITAPEDIKVFRTEVLSRPGRPRKKVRKAALPPVAGDGAKEVTLGSAT